MLYTHTHMMICTEKIEQVHHVQILIDVSRCVHLMYYYYHSHNITTLQYSNKLGCYILNERFSFFSCYEDKHRKFSPPQGMIIFCTQTREDFFEIFLPDNSFSLFSANSGFFANWSILATQYADCNSCVEEPPLSERSSQIRAFLFCLRWKNWWYPIKYA